MNYIYKFGFILLGLTMVMLISGSSVEAEDARSEFEYDDHGKRDPFWELVTPSGTVINYETDYMIADLVLEGIMSGEADTSIAIINGRVVKKGDKVGNFQVLTIADNTVILVKDKKKFELRLKKEE